MQLLEVERLGQIVVYACVESLNPFVHIIPGGEHQHRCGVAAAAQPAAQLHPGEVRQRPVQHHQIKAFLAPTQQGVLAVVAADAPMTGAMEFLHQEPQQFRVVIDDQQPVRLRAQRLDAIASG